METEKNVDIFRKDISDLCKKHNVTNFYVTGKLKEQPFVFTGSGEIYDSIVNGRNALSALTHYFEKLKT